MGFKTLISKTQTQLGSSLETLRVTPSSGKAFLRLSDELNIKSALLLRVMTLAHIETFTRRLFRRLANRTRRHLKK